jgi:hypothetical protein
MLNAEVDQFFTLSRDELAAVATLRGPLNRLSVALQIGYLRVTGQSPRARSSWRQGQMSTYARLQECVINETVLLWSRRTPELSPLSISHVPTCPRRYPVLSVRTSDGHSARYSGSCLNKMICSSRMLQRRRES